MRGRIHSARRFAGAIAVTCTIVAPATAATAAGAGGHGGHSVIGGGAYVDARAYVDGGYHADGLCASRSYIDPVDDESHAVDVKTATFGFDCSAGMWTVILDFNVSVPADARVQLDLDTDPRSTTLDDADAWVYASLDDGSFVSAGRWVNGNPQPAWSWGYVVKVSATRRAFVFTADSIGGPAAFQWHGRVSKGSAVDAFSRPGLFYAKAPAVTVSTRGTTGAPVFVHGPDVKFARDEDTVVAGDWNGDGRDDLLFYGYGRRPESTLLSRSTGSFGPVAAPNLTGFYDWVIAGDFNGDGRDDLFLYGYRDAPDKLLYGRTDGRFNRGPDVSVTGAFWSISAADFNGDGKDDLFLYGFGRGSDRVLLGRAGTPAFGSGPAVTVNGEYGDAVAGDYDGDGFGDVVFWPYPGSTGRLMRGGLAGFTNGTAPRVAGERWSRAAVDYDGDGRDDLVQYGRGADTDGVYHARADATFAAKSGVNITGPYTHMVGGDFNADGKGDVVLWGNGTLPDRVWYGNG